VVNEKLFWSKVVKLPSGCWEYREARNKAGCGIFHIQRRAYLAHRVAWMLTHGDFDVRLKILHRCDNPPCVNPEHLFVGTQADNMFDMKAKGRVARGEAHWNRKFTEEQVSEIRADTRKQKDIAKDFGVSESAICKIRRVNAWKLY